MSYKTNNIDDYLVDVVSSNSINGFDLRFLLVFVPMFWISLISLVPYILFYINLFIIFQIPIVWFLLMLFLPLVFFFSYLILILANIIVGKLILILLNLIHKPKEGVFKAEKGHRDFIFWRLRTQLKKIVLWLIHNCPIPWIDVWAFKWFGIKMNFSSKMNEAWCDIEFIKLGRRAMIGQGAVIMSSMIIGRYLIIRKVKVEDYSVIGGYTTISPGTRIGSDSILGALGVTSYNQKLESEYIYFGFPAIKLKVNKLADIRKTLYKKIDVVNSKKILENR